MRRVQSSTPGTWTVVSVLEAPATPFSDTARRRRSLKIFSSSFQGPGARAQLPRATSATEAPDVPDVSGSVSSCKTVDGVMARPKQFGSGQLPVNDYCHEEQQHQFYLRHKSWTLDEAVSCFTASAENESSNTQPPENAKLSGRMLFSSFSATAQTPIITAVIGCTTPPGRQTSQMMAATGTAAALSRSGSSNGSSNGKRAYGQPGEMNDADGPTNKSASPRGQLRRVRRVVRDLDRMDEP